MPQRDQPWLRHQQQRWMRPDAHRWVRPDAARFLKPGTDPVEVYPALALKYSPNQPRIPAGRTGGGRWSRDGEGGVGSPSSGAAPTADGGEGGDGPLSDGDATAALGFAEPMGNIDFGDLTGFRDLSSTDDLSPLVHITVRPNYADGGGVQLAGDIPDSETPFEDPAPKIPKAIPETREGRMGFIRSAAGWIGRNIGRYSLAVDAFLGALDQIEQIKTLTDAIKSANDPARTLDVLQRPIGTLSWPGYHDHHIVGQHDGNRKRFGNARIDSWENQVRIPALKHIEISRWYSTGNKDFGELSPRDWLRDKSWDKQMEVGLDILRRYEVLK